MLQALLFGVDPAVSREATGFRDDRDDDASLLYMQ
jgi:hypothetical protein